MLLLIAIVIILFFISYLLSDKDIINPIVLSIMFWILTVLSSIYNADNWGYELTPLTLWLIGLSLTAMVLGGFLAKQLKTSGKKIGKQVKLNVIEVKGWKYIFVWIIGAITAIIYVRSIISIGRSNGFTSGSGISVLIKLYRNISHFSTDAEDKVSGMAAHLMELFRISVYMVTYVGVNNIVVSRQFKGTLKYFIITIFFLILTTITGARMQIIKMSLYIALVYFICYKKSRKWNIQIKISTIIKVMISMALILVLFVNLRSFVGRSTAMDPIRYITMYTGGSVKLLDMFTISPIEKSNIWGKETLYQIYNFLGRRLGISEWKYVFAKEFRRINGVSIGNVYTALRSFYYDFGIIGSIVISFIIGFVFTTIYYKIGNSELQDNIDRRVFFYCYYAYSICLMSINFYFDYISIAFLTNLLYFYFLDFIFFRLKVKYK